MHRRLTVTVNVNTTLLRHSLSRPSINEHLRLAHALALARRRLSTDGKQESSHAKASSSQNDTDNKHNAASAPDLSKVDLSPQSTFATPTVASLALLPRMVKYSLSALAAIFGISMLALEGTHLYVEHVALAPAPSRSEDAFGWSLEYERWTGSPEKGGTDPALGWKARHALRAAWVALHWGTGMNVLRSNSLAYAQQAADQGAVEASLEYAREFLTLALTLARAREEAGKVLRKESKREILARHAEVLERIGSVAALWDARAEYEKIWEWLAAEAGVSDDEKARLASKLGDVNARLGDGEEAQTWWTKCLANSSSPASESLPTTLPTSPYPQRTLAATLASVSAHRARSGELAKAQQVQDLGIALLSSPAHSSEAEAQASNTSASAQLHSFFISQRAALLALHRAQVLHALRHNTSTSEPNAETLEALEHSARASENVVHGLCSRSASSTLASDTIANGGQLASRFLRDKTLEKPAGSLLRDARRTAIGAWVMAAGEYERASPKVLTSPTKQSQEVKKKLWIPFTSTSTIDLPDATSKAIENKKAALACYERALALAGLSPAMLEASSSDVSSSSVGKRLQMLGAEYTALVGGYARVRDAVLRDALAGKGPDGPGRT